MKFLKSTLCALLSAALLLCSGCGTTTAATSTSTEETTDDSPVTISVWTYYNGDQLDAFNSMVDEFNQTVGQEKNINVVASSQGGVNELETSVLASAEGKVGAEPMPNIFSAYADTAYALDQMGQIVDLKNYLTDDEIKSYVDGYLTEGDFDGNGSIKILPVAKSTELMFINQTDWDEFAQATGATYDDLSTIEGLVDTAEKYYNWTDSQTPEAGDGKALFGRDAMANYMLIGAKQLGCTIFQVKDGKMTLDFPEDIARKLWDNYYVPYVKGYFAASGKFRSDDVKTGNIIAYVGSTSSSSFFPAQVITSDTESHDIQRDVLPCPHFKDGENYAVQQGAGMVVTKASEREIQASVEFLRWFTDPTRNISFSVSTGYLPVTKSGSNMDTIRSSGLDISADIEAVLTEAVNTVNQDTMYTPTAFSKGTDARAVLENTLNDAAAPDRATVEERLAQGQTLEEATAEFLTDEHFNAWYQNTLTALKEYEG